MLCKQPNIHIYLWRFLHRVLHVAASTSSPLRVNESVFLKMNREINYRWCVADFRSGSDVQSTNAWTWQADADSLRCTKNSIKDRRCCHLYDRLAAYRYRLTIYLKLIKKMTRKLTATFNLKWLHQLHLVLLIQQVFLPQYNKPY